MNVTVEKKCNPKRASRFFIASFVIITVLWGFSFTSLMTPGFWQALAVVYFAFATYFGVKFYMTEYTYTLCDDGFIVIKRVGQKSTKVCHVDVAMISCVYSKMEWQEQKKNRQITSVYNYNASALPDEYYVLVFEMDEKKTAVVFEGSREMVSAINDVILGSKENQ